MQPIFVVYHFVLDHILAGLPQKFTLTFNTGSYEMPEGSELHLELPDTLSIESQDLVDGILKLPRCQPNQEVNFDLELFAALPTGAVHEQKICKKARIIIII